MKKSVAWDSPPIMKKIVALDSPPIIMKKSVAWGVRGSPPIIMKKSVARESPPIFFISILYNVGYKIFKRTNNIFA